MKNKQGIRTNHVTWHNINHLYNIHTERCVVVLAVYTKMTIEVGLDVGVEGGIMSMLYIHHTLCVCAYAHMCTHKYACMRIFMHVYTYTHVDAYMHIYSYTHICTYICSMCMCICTYTYTCVHNFAYMHRFTHIMCIQICVYVFTYI